MSESDLGALLSNAGTLGGAGILVVIVGILARLWWTSEKRHDAELVRVNAAHDAELAEVRADVAELRQKYDELNQRFDEERELRRQAEDRLAEALRKLGGG